MGHRLGPVTQILAPESGPARAARISSRNFSSPCKASAALPELDRARFLAGLFCCLTRVQIEQLLIGAESAFADLFPRPDQLLERVARGCATAENGGKCFVGDRAEQLHFGILRRGGSGLVHERDAVTKRVPFRQAERQIPTAQRPGAAQINARQLIVRPSRQRLLQRRDAIDHCLFVARQSARIERRRSSPRPSSRLTSAAKSRRGKGARAEVISFEKRQRQNQP